MKTTSGYGSFICKRIRRCTVPEPPLEDRVNARTERRRVVRRGALFFYLNKSPLTRTQLVLLYLARGNVELAHLTLPLDDVFSRNFEKQGTVTEHTDAAVALAAQQPTDFPCLVTVINRQRSSF